MCDFEFLSDCLVLAATVVKHFYEKSKVLVEGELLHLECRTWGFPPPQIRWTRLSRSRDNAVEIVTGERVSLDVFENVGNASLKIADVSVEDYGTYTCVAQNGIGNMSDSEAILIRVKGMITLIHCLFLQAVMLNFINLFMSYSFKDLSIKYVHTDGGRKG